MNVETNYRSGTKLNNDANSEAYGKLLPLYEEFCTSMAKSDFKNSPTRYVTELNYVKSLKEAANKKNLEKDVEKWQKKEDEITLKLKEYGITINKQQ